MSVDSFEPIAKLTASTIAFQNVLSLLENINVYKKFNVVESRYNNVMSSQALKVIRLKNFYNSLEKGFAFKQLC